MHLAALVVARVARDAHHRRLEGEQAFLERATDAAVAEDDDRAVGQAGLLLVGPSARGAGANELGQAAQRRGDQGDGEPLVNASCTEAALA